MENTEETEALTAQLPKHLKDWLKKRAKKNNRDMTKELVDILHNIRLSGVKK